MKPIAVITNNIEATFEWLKEKYSIDEIYLHRRMGLNTKTGQRYVLVIHKDHVYGWEFSGMIVSPFYESLEQVVRSRVR